MNTWEKAIFGVTAIIVVILGIVTLIYTPSSIEEFKYKGHDMLKYTSGISVSVCHSPTCKKCYQIFD